MQVRKYYLPDPKLTDEEYGFEVSPLDMPDDLLPKLPPFYITAPELDSLRDQSMLFARQSDPQQAIARSLTSFYRAIADSKRP